MKKIIDKKNNQVLYGIYDEKIDFNHKDYVLHNFLHSSIFNLNTSFISSVFTPNTSFDRGMFLCFTPTGQIANLFTPWFLIGIGATIIMIHYQKT